MRLSCTRHLQVSNQPFLEQHTRSLRQGTFESGSYKHSHIQKAARALQNSTKTSLRIDDDGLLSLQFLMPSPRVRPGKSANAFVEFRVRPACSLCCRLGCVNFVCVAC